MSDAPEKRSWRQKPDAREPSDGSSGPQKGPSGNASADDNKSGRRSGSQRFKGGRASVAGRSNATPTWYRLFFPVTALLLIVATLVTLLLWFLPDTKRRPLLVAWAVTDFNSPLIPLNDFALRDVRKIQRADGFSAAEDAQSNAQNLQTERGFGLFFENTLGAVDAESIVVYLSTHGVSDENGAYLLHAESSTEPSSGYPLERVLRRMAECKARNKLLILDATRIGSDLDLGLLGNDFAYHLEREFEKVRRRLEQSPEAERGNLWVLCSSSDGQRAWTSPSLKHSAFGLAVAYCLRGGGDADVKGRNDEPDGVISAEELVEFVSVRVPGWSLANRDALQSPLRASVGSDFPLVDVDQQVNLTTLVDEPIELPRDEVAEEDAGEEKQAVAKGAEETASKAKDAPAPTGVAAKKGKGAVAKGAEDAVGEKPLPEAPTASEVAQRIGDFWRRRAELAEAPTAIERPLQWNLFQRKLMRCERLLIGDQLKDAKQLLEGELASLLRSLNEPPARLELPVWSLAFDDPARPDETLGEHRKIIEGFLAKPEDPSVLEPIPLVEAELLRMLARQYLSEKEWTDRDAVDFAVRTRTKAESVARLPEPSLLPFVRGRIDEGDRLRREGELALMLGRVDEARGHFTGANSEYEAALAETRQLRREWSEIRRMTTNVPYVIRWLGADPGAREGRVVDLSRLRDFLDRLARFRTDATSASFEELAAGARDLREKATYYAENSWQRGDGPQRAWAALELPFIEPRLRADLLEAIVERADGEPVAPATRGRHDALSREAASPFPLRGFFGAVTDSKILLEELAELDPGADQRVTVADVIGQPSLRGLRARAGSRVRETLALRSEGSTDATATIWERELRRRLVSAFESEFHPDARDGDPVLRRLRDESLAEQLAWTVQRFATDLATLADAEYRGTLNRLNRRLGEWRPALAQRAGRRHAFEWTDNRALAIPTDGQEGQHRLTLRALRDPREGTTAVLVFDWYLDRDRFVLRTEGSTAGQEPSDGRLVILLPAIPNGKTHSVTLAFKHSRLPDALRLPRMSARIEHSDGGIDWMPIGLEHKEPEVKPAELLIANDRVRLYPNQWMPIELAVRKNAKAALALQVEFDGGGAAPLIVDVPTKEGGINRLPVTPPANQRLELVDRRTLTIRLRDARNPDETIDERSIRFDLLDPNGAFRREVAYDRVDRTVSAKIVRLARSDLAEPVVLKLDLDTIDVKQGRRIVELAPDRDAATLTATVPPDADDDEITVFVTACGVPRVFRQVVVAGAARGVPLTDLSLRIAAPVEQSKYERGPTSRALSLQVQADGRPNDPVKLEVAIDDNENHLFDDEDERIAERSYPTIARDARVELRTGGDPKSFLIGSAVSDISIPLPTEGLGGKQTIVVRVTGADQFRTESVTTFFLDEAPGIDLQAPRDGRSIPKGEPLEAVVLGDRDFFGAIDDLEFGFDENANGRWDVTEKVIPLFRPAGVSIRFGADNRTLVAVPTDRLTLGRNFLMVRAATTVVDPKAKTGRRELKSDPPVFREINVVAPVEAKKDPAKVVPKFGSIVGRVVDAAGAGKSNLKVIAPGLPEAKSASGGKFRFENVPPGQYAIKAENYRRAGVATVKVEAGKEAKVDVVIRLK